jgi:hypothetical protein
VEEGTRHLSARGRHVGQLIPPELAYVDTYGKAHQYPSGGPQRVMYSGGRLYLARCNQLAVYDKNLKPLYTLETPLDAVNGIAVEGGRIYVAGQKAGKYATAALESGGAPEPVPLLTALAAASIATALILKRLRKH